MGRMQAILEEVAADIKAGDIPLFEIYKWCIWETMAGGARLPVRARG
jgi:hypothetical protein